jgi:Zn-dependent protease
MGIPIGLDYSWFLIFALLYWFTGAATAIMLFGSVLVHELGHSVVALRFKIPVRSITLFIFLRTVQELGA